MTNTLYYGSNLDRRRERISDESVDLVCADLVKPSPRPRLPGRSEPTHMGGSCHVSDSWRQAKGKAL